MLNSIDVLTFVMAFIILYFSLSLISKLRRKDVFKARLDELMIYKARLLREESTVKRAYRREREESLPWLRKFVHKVLRSGEEEQIAMKKLFVKAGLKSENASLYYGVGKILFVFPPAIFTGFLVFYFTKWNLLYKSGAILVAALLGSYMVDFILNKLVQRRQERIRKAFPEALDLMVICTEAGLSLTATVQRVAREIAQICPDLGFELALLSIELNMLPDRRKALQNFSDRMDSPHFKTIVANIMQAEQYGTPIAQTMRNIAEQFRQDRLVEAEERAAKLPVLLSLPMMALIFPCIYIVIIGPAVIKVMDALAH